MANFIDNLNNFETIFHKNLTESNYNSVDAIFAKNSLAFIKKLRDSIDFSKYSKFDKNNSTIEVDDEGATHIILKHKGNLAKELLNSIEIFIDEEITIEWHGITHNHFFLGDKDLESEEDEAIRSLKDILDHGSKLKIIYVTNKVIASGIWDEKYQDFSMVYGVRPILYLISLISASKKREEIFFVDWR